MSQKDKPHIVDKIKYKCMHCGNIIVKCRFCGYERFSFSKGWPVCTKCRKALSCGCGVDLLKEVKL